MKQLASIFFRTKQLKQRSRLFKGIPTFPVSVALLALSLTLITTAFAAGEQESVDPDANYDRLDGTGKSGKRVDVIEWEDNLEVHVYPKGSVAGLGFVIDDKTNKGKKVMVISYRFNNAPKMTLIRRAILGIPLKAPFKVYKDATEQEFDKIVISNNTLSGSLVAFKTDPEPTQLYPDGHPAIAQAEDSQDKSQEKSKEARAPANTAPKPAKEVTKPKNNQVIELDDSGTIKPFFME